MSRAQPRKTWFERNPRKTIGFLLLIFLVGSTYLAEKWLQFKNGPDAYRLGITRYIKLRELEPGYRDVLIPTDLGMQLSDTLVRKPYRVRVDEHGFLMPSRVHAKPDLSFVFLGGSTTECLYMDEDHRFPYLTGVLVERQTGKKVNSYNGGKSGNNSLNAIDLLLNKVMPLHPDIVVFMENINDLMALLIAHTYWPENFPARSPLVEKKPDFKTVGKNLQEAFHLARDLLIPNLAREFRKFSRSLAQADEFGDVRGKRVTIDKDYLVGEFAANLHTFIAICKARKIQPVLMTQENRLKEQPDPFIAGLAKIISRGYGPSYHEFKDIYDAFNDTIRRVGRQDQVPVIDLDALVPKENKYMIDMVHFNDAGSQYAAKLISAQLLQIISKN